MRVFVFCLFVSWSATGAGTSAMERASEAGSGTRGREIYSILAGSGALDGYMADLTKEITAQLASVSRQRYQVNGIYRDGYTNVYLLDANRIPETGLRIRDAKETVLKRSDLAGNAFTDLESSSILIDTGLLKQYLASAMRKREAQISLLQATAEVQMRGLDSFGYLWDPAVNPELKSRAAVRDWLNLLRGMIAFVVAHESGHLHSGTEVARSDDDVPTLTNARERDLRHACWDMLTTKARSIQTLETQADDYAARLISQIQFPAGALRAPLLWYELGAQSYLMYILNTQMLIAAGATTSNYLRAAMRIQLGNELYSAVIAREGIETGALHIVYPTTHPATVDRVYRFLQAVASSPYSYHHGHPLDYAEFSGIKFVIDPACAELRRKYATH
jgi:hypothetical protein